MAKAFIHNIDTPDEKRDFPLGNLELVHAGDLVFGRATFQPGWRWTTSMKPIVGTALCMNHHNGYVVDGSMHIQFEDGTTYEVRSGDVFVVPPGHDAWVVGDTPCTVFDFAPGVARYAQPES